MSGYLADENFPGGAVRELRKSGIDVAWVREAGAGEPDSAVLARAMAEDRVLLTFDKDFGELAFRHGLPSTCGIVLFRIAMSPPGPGIARVVSVLLSRKDWSGHFWSIEPERVRARILMAVTP